jgi:hypothetical protein
MKQPVLDGSRGGCHRLRPTGLDEEVTMSDLVVRMLITVVALLIPAQAALAGFGATESYLLSVGEGAGAAGSHWYTTVWITNPTDQDAQLRVELLERGMSNTSPQVYTGVVPPGETLYLEDALETMFALSSRFGAFRFVSDRTIIVTSRIYSMPSGGAVGDSVGQLFTAVPAELAIGAEESTELVGVSQTSPVSASELRYNFGLVETGGGNVTVRVSAYEGYDPTVALATKEYTLGPYGVMQQNISDLLPSPQAVGVRLTLEVLSGSTGKVAAFGSGLANRSNDPSTFEMRFDESLLGNGTGNGGLQQVHHDGTLVGEGTSSSPLGVATGGVGSAQLLDGSVGSDDLATGAVDKQSIGGFAPVYVAEEIAGNQFQIAGGEPGLKVSWQVTGIRHDPWAEANRIPVEEPKTGVEQGTYIHPRAYGRSEDLSSAWAHRPEKLAEEQRIRSTPQEMQRQPPMR